jgi:hypothetical protein
MMLDLALIVHPATIVLMVSINFLAQPAIMRLIQVRLAVSLVLPVLFLIRKEVLRATYAVPAAISP